MRRSGAHRHWLIWVATVPLAAWAIMRGFGLERGSVDDIPGSDHRAVYARLAISGDLAGDPSG